MSSEAGAPETPLISVVIAGNGRAATDSLDRCLQALHAQPHEVSFEVVAALGGVDAGYTGLGEKFADVRLFASRESTALPRLRAAAIEQASGQIIAVIDPFTVVPPGWLDALGRSHRENRHAAIGGPVDLHCADDRSLMEWAVFINEYGMFLPPMEAAAMELLPGCNVSYKRKALAQAPVLRQGEFWKSFANDYLRDQGGGLLLDNTLTVGLDKPIGAMDYVWSRLDHGRCYGGMRAAQMKEWERALRLATAPALPLILLARWIRRYWSRRRYRSKLVLTLPLQLVMFCAWATGEAAGYLRGPGTSCRRLFY